jgi:hypothetical protein
MLRRFLTGRIAIPVLLCLQVLPLIVFPLNVFKIDSQEWWLPAFLCLLIILSLVKLFFGKENSAWPWYIMAFCQGLNIISRIMMLLPHATLTESGGAREANVGYIVIAFACILFSVFEIWYCELPELRQKISIKMASRAVGAAGAARTPA